MIGINAMDNFVLYNGGYRVLNGFVPFNDYWLVTGPLLDYLNSFFFYIFGVNWKSFIYHSSIFNLIISVSTYLLLISLNLRKEWSLFYSLLFCILMYPTVGTPFVDHHSTIFLLLSFYIFIYCIKKENYIYFCAIPFLMVLSFLSKQTPALYGIIGIIILYGIFSYLNKEFFVKTFLYFFYGSIFSFIFLILFFVFTSINFEEFFSQYILFAKNVGSYRFSLFNLNLHDIHEYKFLLFNLIFVVIFLIYSFKENNKKSIIILSGVFLINVILIFHQKLTSNQNYIFFLIPLTMSFIHLNYEKYFPKKKIILLTLILICLLGSIKYHLRFNENRKFNELEKVDLKKAVSADIIDESLRGLKWITKVYPNNPEKEIGNLKEAMEIIKKNNKKKAIITSYQFIAPALGIYDYSPNQWHHPSVSFPLEGQKYFLKYKSYFITNLKKNNIQGIYTVGIGEENIPSLILDKSCYQKKKLGKFVFHYELLNDCGDFK